MGYTDVYVCWLLLISMGRKTVPTFVDDDVEVEGEDDEHDNDNGSFGLTLYDICLLVRSSGIERTIGFYERNWNIE